MDFIVTILLARNPTSTSPGIRLNHSGWQPDRDFLPEIGQTICIPLEAEAKGSQKTDRINFFSCKMNRMILDNIKVSSDPNSL